jgi:hypothetical protein
MKVSGFRATWTRSLPISWDLVTRAAPGSFADVADAISRNEAATFLRLVANLATKLGVVQAGGDSLLCSINKLSYCLLDLRPRVRVSSAPLVELLRGFP